MTADASSDSMATERVDRPSAITSVSSAMQPSTWNRARRLFDGAARPYELFEQLVELVRRSHLPRPWDAERLQHPARVLSRQREPLLHHRLPPFQAGFVDLAQHLGVHQAVTDLDVRVIGREQVELRALDGSIPRRELREGIVGRPEAGPERSPLPARDDRHRRHHEGMLPCETVKTPPRLTTEQLGEVLGLLSGADSAELKLTVPESDHYQSLRALRVDPLDAR